MTQREIAFKPIHYWLVLPLYIFILSSCKKDSHSIPQSSFTWTYNNINYKANFDTVYLYGPLALPSIVAGTGTSMTSLGISPRIGLENFNLGVHHIAVGTYEIFGYEDELGNPLYGASGDFTITSNANQLLSGNFSVTLTNNKIISGNFINIGGTF